jgi:hypothetical protein
VRWLILVAAVSGCNVTSSSTGVHPWDVRGNYALTYDDHWTLQLVAGSSTRHTSSDGKAMAPFGDFNGQTLTLDVAAFCARPDVFCPDEAVEPRISIDQSDAEMSLPRHDIDLVGALGVHHAGVVDHDHQDTFLVGLGGAAAGVCAALGTSVSTGRFTHRGETVTEEPAWVTGDGAACDPGSPDGGGSGCTLSSEPGGVVWPGDAPVDGIADGRITTAWSGACAFAGLPAGATFTFTTGFVGSRTGDYDPPAPPDASATLDASEDLTLATD